MNNLPPEIDKSEAQLPWDFTRPAAIEKAEFVEFNLNEAIKAMFPHWASGVWLDMHAQTQGLSRRPARNAFGYLLVVARQGTVIPQNFQFATVSNLTPSILFQSTDDVTFDADTPDVTPPPGVIISGMVVKLVPVESVVAGTVGNVPPDSVKLMLTPDTNVSYISNQESITGGTPAESDDDLRERVLEAIRYGISYAGRDADYVRWAKEIAGVGSVVVDPEWMGPGTGTVRLFIVDSNGVPANIEILEEVFDYIIRPDDRMERLAPINAILTVAAPEPVEITITASVLITADTDIPTVTEAFKLNLDKYWLSAATEFSSQQIQAGYGTNTVRYVFIGAALADTAGVIDYDHMSLTVNGAADNINIPIGFFPVTGEVTLSVY